MKSKTFIILIAICLVLAGAVYFIYTKDQKKDAETKPAGDVFANLPVNDVASVKITSPESEVELKKGDPVWIVENRFGYPADFKKIADFVKKVRDLKVGRTFNASEDTLTRLALNSPDKPDTPDDQKGTRVLFEDKDQKVLMDVVLGKAREADSGHGGHYVKSANEFSVYVVDQNFRYINKKPEEWIDKELIDVKAKDIEKVVCVDPENEGPLYTLQRPEKDKDPEFLDAPEGKKIKKAKINGIFGALSSFRIEDVADPAKDASETAAEKALRYEFHLFDGTVYHVFPGKAVAGDDNKYYVKAEVKYAAPTETPSEETPETGGEKPPGLNPDDIAPEPVAASEPMAAASEEKKDGDDAKDEEAAKKETKSPAELAADAEKLNQKVSPWTFVIAKWKHEKYVADPGDFFEEEEKEEAGGGSE